MLPIIIGGILAALAVKRNPFGGQAVEIPQFRGGGVEQNAVAAPQPIVPLAMGGEVYPGSPPPGPMQPVGLGSIPDLSELTEFEHVMALPDPDALLAVQINPNMNNISYGRIRG